MRLSKVLTPRPFISGDCKGDALERCGLRRGPRWEEGNYTDQKKKTSCWTSFQSPQVFLLSGMNNNFIKWMTRSTWETEQVFSKEESIFKKDLTEILRAETICSISPAPKRRKQRPREMEVWLSSKRRWPSLAHKVRVCPGPHLAGLQPPHSLLTPTELYWVF